LWKLIKAAIAIKIKEELPVGVYLKIKLESLPFVFFTKSPKNSASCSIPVFLWFASNIH
jgi:hypothetical protein